MAAAQKRINGTADKVWYIMDRIVTLSGYMK